MTHKVRDIKLIPVSVGNLGSGVNLREVLKAFMPFGCLRYAAWHSAGEAVVWFEEMRDAKEAIGCLNKRFLVVLVN